MSSTDHPMLASLTIFSYCRRLKVFIACGNATSTAVTTPGGYSLEQYLCQMCEGYPHYQNIHEEHIHSKIPGGMPS